MLEKHTQNFKGYYIPIELQKVGLCRTEQFLLSMIDSLDSGKPNYCYASNEYLAVQLEVSPSIISRYISNLKKLKFIEEVSFSGRVRRLKSLKHNWYLPEQERIISKKESYAPGDRQTTHEVTGRLRKECEAIYIEEDKEKTTNKEQLVVVQNYECLAKANLSKEDCKALMFYPENRVKLALSFIDNKKFEVKTTRIASLIWHCQQEIPPVHAETKEDFIAKKESEADEIFERVAINKEKFKRLKIKHWNELAVKPRDNHELVEFDVNKIYFKDKDFDRLILKAFKDNKKEEITECEDYDF